MRKISRIPSVIAVEYLHDYVLRLTFDDGLVREVDLEGELWGPAFEPLRDPAYFRRVRIADEGDTIEWPNGADFAPEFLHGDYETVTNAGDRETR